ncbi:hypothetical protein OIU79_005073 [Salix purpurea]|uniref:Uncharacterized protein n=1 Tax=Salix purpurea TaxID=77065 RepID=A0A9Q0ZAE4_SALPP|nr:hypothetical protein OIU79_005073 [Salix purpurea]
MMRSLVLCGSMFNVWDAYHFTFHSYYL